jgi:RNA polymerase sigma-70 factor (ECF subfamily)
MAKTTPATPVSVSRGAGWLAALHAAHAAELLRFALGIVRERAVAEDVVQAVFAKAVEALGQLPEEAAKPWLFRVAFNEAITCKRKARTAQRAAQAVAQHAKEQIFAAGDEPLVRQETIEQVRAALETLPDDQRRVVHERIYHDKTFARIATEMGLPLGTVLTHMRRALEKIKRTLNRHE